MERELKNFILHLMISKWVFYLSSQKLRIPIVGILSLSGMSCWLFYLAYQDVHMSRLYGRSKIRLRLKN